MKEIKLNNTGFEGAEVLSRAQLKTIMGGNVPGDGGGGGGGGGAVQCRFKFKINGGDTWEPWTDIFTYTNTTCNAECLAKMSNVITACGYDTIGE